MYYVIVSTLLKKESLLQCGNAAPGEYGTLVMPRVCLLLGLGVVNDGGRGRKSLTAGLRVKRNSERKESVYTWQGEVMCLRERIEDN